MLKLNQELEQTSFEAGKFVKLHGVAGRLVLRLNSPAEELADFPEWGFVRLDGELVPFQVAEESVIQKDTNHLILGFEGINTQEQARELLGKYCNLPGTWKNWFGAEEIPEKSWTGFTVIDHASGMEGILIEIQEIPGNPLLEIAFGEKRVLVPDNPAFILAVDEKTQRLTLQIPTDLLSL